MTQYSAIPYYSNKCLEVIEQYNMYNIIANMMEATDLGVEPGAATAYFPVDKEPTGSVTPLAATGPTTSDAIDNVQIPITFGRYGDDYETVNKAWSKEVVYPLFETKIKTRAKAGQLTSNILAANALFKTINPTGAYAHVYGNIADVIASKIVHLGTDPTTSLAARTSIDETMIMDSGCERLVNMAFAHLKARKSPKFQMPNGANTYLAICHPYVIKDIKDNCQDFKEFALHYGQGEYIAQGIVGQFGGFYFIEADDNAIFSAGGADSVDVYPILFCGANFLGKVYRGTANLPVADGAESQVTRIPVNEFLEVRVAPGTDAQRLTSQISYLMELGWGVLNPRGSFRVEVAASATPAP